MSADGLSDVFDAGVTHGGWGTVTGPLGLDAAAVLSAAERERAYAMTAEAGLHYAGAHVAVRFLQINTIERTIHGMLALGGATDRTDFSAYSGALAFSFPDTEDRARHVPVRHEKTADGGE